MIVDMRLRPVPSFLGASGGSPALCVREMDEAGITHGVIMGRQTTGGPYPKIVPNDEIDQVCKDYPGRFVAFAGVNIADPDPAGSLKEIERCILELGFTGVNVEPAISSRIQYADDPSLFPIYARCRELGVPLSLSLSIMIAPDLTYCDPTPVQRVARSFPDLTIIVSHACWPWVDQAVGVALACPNVYLSLDYYVTTRMPGYRSYVDAANGLLEDRLLFGTAAYPGGGSLKEKVNRWKELPFRPGVLEKVLGANAARILKLM